MLVIAHRGLSAHYPENTMIAFEQAIEGGAKAIECDVHQVENSFIVFHDFYLQHLTGAEGSLAQITMEQVRQLKVKQTPHGIPSLQEVFQLSAGKVLLNLELKTIHNPALFVEQLCDCANHFENHEGDLEIVVSSFNHPLLQSIRTCLRDTALENKVKFAALIAHLPLENAQYAVDMQADVAAIDAELVTEEFVEHAHKHYLKVWCYTVNHKDQLVKMLALGVDGIFSDDVRWANEIVEQH